VKSIPKLTDLQEENLWKRILIQGPKDCWPWMGSDMAGYGTIHLGTKVYYVSRVVFLVENGIDPLDMDVLHTCDNPPCCNPLHLFLGTHSDNMLDSIRKGRHSSQRKGTQANSSVLTTENVLKIRQLLALDTEYKEIAALFNISKSTVKRINLGLTYKEVH
jgi:hypothetical protein